MSVEHDKDFPIPRPASRVPKSQTVSFATLGCKTNQFESASMQESLQSAGYVTVSFDEGADLVIVNTCTVTNATDAQSRNLIRRARKLNPKCRVVVTGCYAQVDPEALHDMPGVSLVIGNEEKKRLLELLGTVREEPRVEVSDISTVEDVCLPPLTTFSGRSRAFVQIQNGCDAYCSYCIIPYARGRSRSAAPDEILSQIKGLKKAGYKEVVLTGIHIGQYGADLTPVLNLNTLINRIVTDTDVHRLRLGSIEPTEITDELIDTIAMSKVVCPHLHIPLQAGDDAVLKRMNRTYDTEYFAEIVRRLRERLPDAALCLDVIVGFPGETDAEFENTYAFLESLPITDLHVFPFSKRPGTPAAEMTGQVPGDVSKNRAEALRTLAAAKHAVFAQGFIGSELEVVVENTSREGLLKGISRNYLDIRFAGPLNLAGQCVNVKAVRWEDGSLVAALVADRVDV